MIPEPEPYTGLLWPALILSTVVIFFGVLSAVGACSVSDMWRKAHGLRVPETKELK